MVQDLVEAETGAAEDPVRAEQVRTEAQRDPGERWRSSVKLAELASRIEPPELWLALVRRFREASP